MKKELLGIILSTTAIVACSSSSGSKSSEANVNGDGTAGETPGEEQPNPGANLGVSAVSARNMGRQGETIQLSISGSDPDGQTSALHVRFTDDNDQPAPMLDSDWDGVIDSAEGTFHFDASTLTSKTFDGVVTIPHIFGAKSKATKAHLSLENEAGIRSAETATPFSAQAVKAVGEACDKTLVESRCEPGLSCGGEGPTCQPGAAPTLTSVAYFIGSSPRMLFRGEEPDEDIASITVEFLDNNSNPKTVVIAGEGQDATSASSISVDALSSGVGPTYLVEALPAASFTSQVPKIAAIAVDKIGRSSERVVASQAALPTRSSGQTCDADGFDACGGGLVCSPGIRTEKNTCKSASTVRSQKCKATPALDPSKGLTRAYGDAVGVSLWDPPSGCIPAEVTGRPEAAIPLVLSAPAAKLTISTALPETSFDTAVFLIPDCAATSAGALGCNDDEKGYSSTLTLKDVPAGKYTIIVESVQPKGGHFGVTVTVE